MRKLIFVGLTVVCVVTGLFRLAGRNPAELRGLMRASADKTVDDLTDQLPKEIHDRKLDQDLAQVRQEVIDRQVQLSLSKNQLDQLRKDVSNLAASTERRQRLLAEAYPILESAVKESKDKVRFASQDFLLADFQKEIDELLSAQDREDRQLTIKRTGLDRLEKGAKEGEQAVAEMRTALDSAEQDVAVLRIRREQAEVEAQTLDMVAAVTNGKAETGASVGKSLDKLKSGVDQLEARNEARRTHAPANERQGANQLAKGWTRLESLKAIHDKVNDNEQGPVK